MDAANRMKTHLSNSLKRLSTQMPLAKITVKDLCQFSNVNRGSFYYHFKDIFDLISWTYHTQIILPAREILKGYQISDMPSVSSYMLKKVFQEREFYSQAFVLEGDTLIKETVFKDCVENWKLLWCAALGGKDYDSVSYAGKDDLMQYFAYGHYYATMRWIQSGMHTDPGELGKLLDDASLRGLVSIWQEIIDGAG